MRIDAAILGRLVALNLPGDSLAGVLSILADLQGADDARLEKQRARTERSRVKKRERNVTEALPSRHRHSDSPPHTPLEASKIPEANASGPTQADLERQLFSRGRQVCGKASGGLIASLLKAKQHDVALARSVIETAATKHDPREYVAAALKGKSNGNGQSALADAFAQHRLDLAELGGEGDGGEGDRPMRDITPGRTGTG